MKKPFCLPEFALWLFVAALCPGLSGTVWMLPVALIAWDVLFGTSAGTGADVDAGGGQD